MQKLPVDDVMDQLLDVVFQNRVAVLRAPPGAGKTSGVPPAILGDRRFDAGQILLVQPRRLAARAAAHRLAELRNVNVGGEVGYHVRFDKKHSESTRIVAVTTGILLRKLATDPLLENVSCVILDEFHERSLEMDLALGMLQRIRSTFRPELKLVVMSATMDPQPILDLIGDSVSLESEGRAFDVQVHYARQFSSERLETQVTRCVTEALEVTSGHLLVFLPGVGEIHRVAQSLADATITPATQIHKLYGDMHPSKQDALLKSTSRRKIVLATNVAETSITIPGVTGVIDSGLARVMRVDRSVGLSELRLEPISQASADQRAGRAGRTEPGHCWRLWPANTHRSRPATTTPEIQRTDFCGAALNLAAWGERDWSDFPWITPPEQPVIDSAKRSLIMLGAVSGDGSITTLGRQLISFPLHPRLSRLMVEANRQGVLEFASMAAAMLSERGAIDPSSRSMAASAKYECDLSDQVLRVQAFLSGARDDGVRAAAAKNVQRVAKQLRRGIDDARRNEFRDQQVSDDHEALAKSLLAAFPDRVARRREPGSDRGKMVGGRGVKLAPTSLAKHCEYFLCLDADASGDEAKVRIASAIDPSWLPEENVRDCDELLFHEERQSVVARRRRYFVDLLLTDSPIRCEPSDATAALLMEKAIERIADLLPREDRSFQSFWNRARFAADNLSEADLPCVDDQTLHGVLRELCATRTSFDQLRNAPWLDHLKGRYTYEQLQRLDRQVPEKLTVPSGNQLRIDYQEGKPPVLAVRIQEIFGWKTTPTIAGGRVRLQLHLLGPNHRPQQITDDLESFWNSTYREVRKELRRRYPKHHWPEDPASAIATRNGLKPRSR